MDKLERLLKYVTDEENKYYDFASKAMEDNNMQSNLVNILQATAFQRVRYAIEDLLENKKENAL